ncbi:MAG: DUF3575 domain-containing protein [Bacteroidota bacterium]
MKKLYLLILFAAFYFPVPILAEKNDSLSPPRQPIHKNVIKFNPTPMILWSLKNITFSYERILSPRQSISLELGYLEFPRLFDDTIINLVNITSHQKKGINVTLEYRFYLTKLNVRPIPAGLYIGPYLTYYGYQFKNGLDLMHPSADPNGMIKGNYWSFNLGLELGYQFVFWKRWTLDLVMFGPSASYFGGETEITGELSLEQIKAINEALYKKLIDRFPVMEYLSVDKTFKQTGKLDILRMGFRYLVQIGFHF